MGWDLIISRFQNAKLPLWCHQSYSSVWRLLEILAWTIHPPSHLLEYIASFRQYWLERGLLQPAYIWVFVSWLHVAVHWEMASFYDHCLVLWRKESYTQPSKYLWIYFTHLLTSGSQGHFYKASMQLKELVQFLFHHWSLVIFSCIEFN